jgi:hypothetical protein
LYNCECRAGVESPQRQKGGFEVYWKVEVENDNQLGRVLVVEGEAHCGKVYVARITGTDPRYRYARQFIGMKRDYWAKDMAKSVIRVTIPADELQSGDLLEIRVGTLNKENNFCIWEGNGVRWIPEWELKKLLEERTRDKHVRDIVEYF